MKHFFSTSTLSLISKRFAWLAIMLAILSQTACMTRTFIQPEPGVVYQKLPSVMDNNVRFNALAKLNTLKFGDEVYLRVNNFSTVDSDEYQDYLVAAVDSMGFFKRISSTTPSFHINAGPDEVSVINNKNWYERKDHYSIAQLKARHKNKDMLVMDFTLLEKTPYPEDLFRFGRNVSFMVKVIDLRSGQVVFFAQNEGKTWMGVDKTIVNPVLNRVRQWLLENAVARKI